ncbi:MAG TPA: FkbM family methyltransferase [Pirellulales bacterium]|jgi:FkbM family methyltransferase|nr:FkbM family methyltransferase [Pirellulales bacterium]
MGGQDASAQQTVKSFQTPCGLTIAHLNKAETEFVYREIFQDRIYLRHGITLRDGDVVFDVGANIGLFTIFVEENFPGVRVCAFEPSPQVYPILEANTAKYGSQVQLYPWGISDASKQATFTYYPSYSIISGFAPNERWNRETIRSGLINQWRERQPGKPLPRDQVIEPLVEKTLGSRQEFTCDLRSVSEAMAIAGVDRIALLKIDAEGSELEILRGIRAEDWPRIDQIAMEIHDADGQRAAETRRMLEEHGFQCVFEQDSRFQDTGIVNAYASRSMIS